MRSAQWLESVNSKSIATSSLASICGLHPNIRELLFQSKNEQTFSGMLASYINLQISEPEFPIMTEIKGVDMPKGDSKLVKNSHDLALVDIDGRISLTIESKVWYHFDGSIGLTGEVNKDVIAGIEGDILKSIRTQREFGNRAFLLLNVITPEVMKKYESAHNTVLKRVDGDPLRFRAECLEGFTKALNSRSELNSIVHITFEQNSDGTKGGFLDVFAAEISA